MNRNVWSTLSFQNDARVMRYAVEKHEVAVEKLLEILPADSFTTMCAFQPLNNIIAQHGIERGGNVMGLDYWMQGQNGILFLAELGFDSAEHEETAQAIINVWANAVHDYAKELGVGWDWQYLNYAGGEQDPLSTVGPDALAKIRAASAKYDPNGVFQSLRGSGFKLPKAPGEEH